jgi:alkanesulfonate monooxygenase SsuD/methylene tetrahydromethanopterin reductase-like flavin-dependent oxidoreductase (luciferase family)
VADHLPGFPHVWATLGEIAAVTTRPRLASAFANNLFRSPVEFAQASLAVQRASGGRFEAGLGAGWMRYEVEGMGWTYPDGPTRAGMYREAVEIVRSLITSGACQFTGRYHNINIAGIGPLADTSPRLTASLGGPRTIREISPLVDLVELKAAGRATRGGELELAALATVTRDELRGLVERVRNANPDVPISFFALCAAGTSPDLEARAKALGDNVYGGIVGHPEKVAANLLSLEELGISRVNVSPTFPGTEEALAPYLFKVAVK